MPRVFDSIRFGKVEIDESKVLHFPKGILGLPGCKDFCILDHGENSPFKWLQSGDDPAIAFVVTNPLLIKEDYKVSPAKEDLEIIRDEESQEVIEIVIVTIPPKNPGAMTANMRAPLLINMHNRKAIQFVILDEEVDIKYPCLEPLQKAIKKMDKKEEEKKGEKDPKAKNG